MTKLFRFNQRFATNHATNLKSPLSYFTIYHESLVILKQNKKYKLKLEVDASLEISANRSEIGQIINNLISNAADAIEERASSASEYQLIIRAYNDNKANFKLEIEDDGPGIKQDQLNKLFEAYYTTKKLGLGTGLGLSIIDKIVRKHGGLIHLLDPIELSRCKISN